MKIGQNPTSLKAPRGGKRLASAAAAVAVAASGLAACSSSGGSSATSGPIKIGIASVESGPAIAYKQIIDGETAYFDMINAEGGIKGRKISYTALDTGYTPDGVSKVVRQLTSQGYPVVSGVASPAVKALVPFMRTRPNTVWVPFTAGDDLLPTSGNIFGVSAQYTRLGAADARFISDLGASKIGVLYEDDAVGQPGESGVVAWLKENGKPAPTSLAFTNTDSDLSAQVARLKSAGVNGVVFWGLAPQFTAFLQAAKSANYNPKVQAFFGLASAAVLKAAGQAADGVYFGETTTSAANCTDGYLQYMTKNHPAEVSPLSEQGWSGGALIVAGIRKALDKGKSITSSSIRTGLESINHTTVGCTPDVTLSPTNHIATTSEAQLRSANGSFVSVKDFTPLPVVKG